MSTTDGYMRKGQKTQKKLEFRLKNKENRQKAGLKSCFGALIGTKQDESAFLGRRAGRSGFGLQIGTVPTRSGRLASMRANCNVGHGAHVPKRVWMSVRVWREIFLLFILFLCTCGYASVRACRGGYFEMLDNLGGHFGVFASQRYFPF